MVVIMTTEGDEHGCHLALRKAKKSNLALFDRV